MTRRIQVAKGLSFPAAEFATEVVASLGMRGGGKSNGAAVIVEDLLAAEVQVIVLDYVGIWPALRLQPDGKTPSPFAIPVLGGKHGDIGLLANTGALVAEALAVNHSPAVLDISAFSKGDRCRFATDFAEAFFHAKKSHPGPVQIVLEEAQRFIPQRMQPDQARMLGAFEEIAEVGRNYGIGLHLISQRPQKLAKDVLNLADTVFAYRTNGVLERKALAEWVQEKGAEGRDEVQGELPQLERGRAIVWCPNRRIYGRFAVRLKTTYDAGATPLTARTAVKIQPLDLGALQAAMGKAAEEAKANDPRALRAEITRLKAEVSKSTGKVPGATMPVERVEVPVVPAEWKIWIDTCGREILAAKEAAQAVLQKSVGTLDAVARTLQRCVDLGAKYAPVALARRPVLPARAPLPPERRPAAPHALSGSGEQRIGAGERKVLTAIAQHQDGVTRQQLTVLTGYKRSTRDAYIQRLRVAGLVAEQADRVLATDAGMDALGNDFEPLPTGPDLLEHWLRELPEGERACLQVVVDAYPEPADREAIGEITGYKRSTRDAYLQRLGSRRLVEDAGPGRVRASEELF